jgi:hypothetical protein
MLVIALVIVLVSVTPFFSPVWCLRRSRGYHGGISGGAARAQGHRHVSNG